MSASRLRVLFCIGINQNFFDLPEDGVVAGDVWQATLSFLDQLGTLPGVDVLGDIDDDSHQVGPSDGWPWTFYVLADVDSQATVKAACNLVRTTSVGESGLKFWRFAKIEARIGRALTVRDDVELRPGASR